MNINDQLALLGYAEMLDDTVSVPGMRGGEPVRILMNEIQRLREAIPADKVVVDREEWADILSLLLVLLCDEDAFERIDDLLAPIHERRKKMHGNEWIGRMSDEMTDLDALRAKSKEGGEGCT